MKARLESGAGADGQRTAGERVGVFSACLPGWSPTRVVEVAMSLGLAAVEWASGRGQAIERGATGGRVRELCERAGLRSGGLAVQDPEVTLATPARAARYVALAAALGAPHVRFMAPTYQGGSLAREQKRVRAGVAQLVELAAPKGVAVLVETSPTTLAPAPELAVALVEGQPPERAGVLYDPGNMVIEGHLAPAVAIARLGPYLRHVHVKNIAWGRRGDAWQWRHASLTTGLLDWRTIVHELAAADYPGLFSIDHLGGEASARKLASESAFLRDLVMTEAGPPGKDMPASKRGGEKSPVSA
jgi:sugar phosphate isomerase/epimerase